MGNFKRSKAIMRATGAILAAILLCGAKTPIGEPTPTAADVEGPWQSQQAAIIIDPYHGNDYTIADLRLDPRIAGVIHKASEGSSIVDTAYASRKEAAIAAGYLWGSYHIGRPGNPEAQAERYFHLVQPAANELIALDLEKDGGEMSMAEAARFIRHLHDLTGRYPVIYGGRYTLSRPVQDSDLKVFKRCPLWIVDTRDHPSGWPTTIWSEYTLWQFSSELRYRYPMKSADPRHKVSWNLDIDYYPAGRDALRQAWPFTKTPQ